MKILQKIDFVIFPLIFIVSFIILISSLLYAQPDEVEFCLDKNRGAVMFPHDLHMESYDCLDCHHDFKNGENVLDESVLEEDGDNIKCKSCHNAEAKTKAREAFHRQCMNCHNSYKMTAVKTGPSLCGECHILKK